MLNKNFTDTYRKDIDGLRGLAVALVILFHAGISQIASGFIGVDIFFAISGFLITGIIVKQREKSTFSLANFFVHRLWRIQPAFIIMSLATLIATFCIYLPDDFLAYLHSSYYNALFLSNQFFARQSAAYASPAADLFPLLHTWSLAIEWQWYLFLPLGILLTGTILRLKSFQKVISNPSNALAAAWFILTPLAVALALIMAGRQADTAYYSLLTRIFEFMMGGDCIFSDPLCSLNPYSRLKRHKHFIAGCVALHRDST
ncbi:acyltransferase family protein [Pantoea agglomerans]|uniref:acyltransferase family protein n=1 Tax=Enterobacter agglomerans TaxID=549 RepID=UPI002898EE9D|nr:acyltransferase [Pantoea agglomerans]WNK34953.1 acyltransferase [Pantoea agglomerans]